MVHIRIGEHESRFPEGQWEAWVSEGRVPPDALVFSPRLTGGLWRRADSLPLYKFFRQTGEEDRREVRRGTPAGTPFAELPAVAFPRRGFSATETLLAINLLVALILASLWRAEYPERIFEVAGLFHRWFREQLIPVGFVTTLFMHAGLAAPGGQHGGDGASLCVRGVPIRPARAAGLPGRRSRRRDRLLRGQEQPADERREPRAPCTG